ncbi:MAG: GNAT family N-acetyltransferase [Acidimicrobiales bacterium]|jgi:ribosomal protein S18 acetylase RimI-like enzyme|nr:GNAT family N-acetyltransferase [Acidimicrobiales bacterium]
MVSDLTLRPAQPGDADRVAEIHAAAWREGFAGILPAARLTTVTAASRAPRWREQLLHPASTTDATIVATLHDTVAGFVVTAVEGALPCRCFEVVTLMVDPQRWRQGIGLELLRSAERMLAAAGAAEIVVWVLADNRRARAFYERAGWTWDGLDRTRTILHTDLTELRYHIHPDTTSAPS